MGVGQPVAYLAYRLQGLQHPLLVTVCGVDDQNIDPGVEQRLGPNGDVLSKLTLAEGGTLYLEGIQFLSHDVQRALAELLTTLDAHQGAIAPQPNVRVIVSTTRTIDEELAAGRIVPELRRRFRLIDLPPLSERLDDLPALADHVLKRHAERAGRVVPQLSARSLTLMRATELLISHSPKLSFLACEVASM